MRTSFLFVPDFPTNSSIFAGESQPPIFQFGRTASLDKPSRFDST